MIAMKKNCHGPRVRATQVTAALMVVARILLACFLSAPFAASAAEVTNVSTPSGATHGSLVGGNIPCASGPAQLNDCGKTAPAGQLVGTSDSQTLTNKTISGAQNTLSAIPDSALSANVDLLNGAQTATGLKTFNGGLALPSGSNPTGSNLYIDSNGALNVVNSNGTFAGYGGCFSGDCSRPWFKNPLGVGVQESSSNATPLLQISRDDWYNGGAITTFGIKGLNVEGKGFTSTLTNDAALGATSITIAANPSITAGMNVYGPGIATGTTVSSISGTALVISQGLTIALPGNGLVSFSFTGVNSAPTNQTVNIQAQCQDYSNDTGARKNCVPASGYGWKYVTGNDFVFGGVFGAFDWSGRKSSIGGCCVVGAEIDLSASGPDDALQRVDLDIPLAEVFPSSDGATTFGYGVRVRPQTAGASAQVGLNPLTILSGFTASTMSGGGGEFGSFNDAFICDGGENIGCFNVTSGSWQVLTLNAASSGQPDLTFALYTNANVGQRVSGSASIAANTTVSAVYQCFATNPVAGCGGATNETLVVLSNNLTGNIASGTNLTFTGVLNDGSNFNAYFTDAIANWTSIGATGLIKAGSTNNSGTVLDVKGFGEDSTFTTGVGYGDLIWAIDANTHGATLGHIGVTNAGFEVGAPTGGNEGIGSLNAQAIYQNGSALGTFAFQGYAAPPAIGGTTPNAGSFTTLAANSDFTSKAHVISNGTALSCSSITFGTGAGASPTCTSVTGDDRHMLVSFSSGTTPSAAANIFTVSFSAPYGSAPQCQMSPANAGAAINYTKAYVTSTASGLSMTSDSSAIPANTAYIFDLQCLQ